MRKFIGTILSLLLCIFIIKVVIKLGEADANGESVNIIKTSVKTVKEIWSDAKEEWNN
jgi:hypothetical protein